MALREHRGTQEAVVGVPEEGPVLEPREVPAKAGALPGARLHEAADAAGNVFFSDIPFDTIYKWSTAGQLSVFRTNSGGANGLAFDAAGNRTRTIDALDRTNTFVYDQYGHVTNTIDALMGRVLSSNARGTERERYRRIVVANLVAGIFLFLWWTPYFARLFRP